MILSLDPSSSLTGYAAMTDARTLIDAGKIKPHRASDPANARIRAMAADVLVLVEQHKPEVVVVEDTSGKVARRHGGGGAGLAVYGKAIGWLVATLEAAGVRVVTVLENDWTRGVGKLNRQRGEGDGKERMMSEQYLVLSLKWTLHPTKRESMCVWYRPEGKGYTTDINAAGRYSHNEIAAHPEWYDNNIDTLAIRESTALAASKPVVERSDAMIQAWRDSRHATEEEAYRQGWFAYSWGFGVDINPYNSSSAAKQWDEGWYDAQSEDGG